MMDNILLTEIRKNYDIKRKMALEDLDNRKNQLYSENPRLEEIDKELSTYSIKLAKNLLNNSSENNLDDLKKFSEKLKKEKIEILKNNGKDLTYLLPNFECKICNDEGYISENYKSVMCNCFKQKLLDIAYNKSNMGNLDRENFETFNLNLYSDKIDNEKYKFDISPRENIKRIKNISEKFINNFDDPEEKNLMLMGNSGLGKTFLSNCIANEMLKRGKTVLYQTAPVMLNEIINYIFDKPDCNKDIMDNLLNVDLLIIDDFGTENVNSMKFTEIFNILNSRLLNQNRKITKTIISTNLTLQNIYSTYDERIVSRIVGYYNICKFFGDDIRFIKK